MTAAAATLPDAPETLARARTIRAARLPAGCGIDELDEGQMSFDGTRFLLRERGFSICYTQAEGLYAQLDDPGQRGRMELFLDGSVHAAIASLAGLYPLHASAVTLNGHVIAFTGPAGAGKSTLCAALARRGLPFHADDTLVIDPARAPLACLPGHKRLKLWPEGLALAGLAGEELVAPDYPKYFAQAPVRARPAMLPLGALVFLEEGSQFSFAPIGGAQRFARLNDDHYTAMLRNRAGRPEAGALFARQAMLARAIPMFRLARPRDPAQFETMLDQTILALDGIARA